MWSWSFLNLYSQHLETEEKSLFEVLRTDGILRVYLEDVNLSNAVLVSVIPLYLKNDFIIKLICF